MIKKIIRAIRKKKAIGKTALLCKKLTTMSSEALTVKLADRLHNVRFLDHDDIPREFIVKRVHETTEMMESLILKRELTRVQRGLYGAILGDLELLRIIHQI